jgi:hypothetical protein
MNTNRYLWRRWARAAVLLLFFAICSWTKINNGARMFFLIATPATIAIALFFYFGGFKKQGKKLRDLKTQPSTGIEPQKRNPPAQLPPLRKQP